jgi:hypothetical protein
MGKAIDIAKKIRAGIISINEWGVLPPSSPLRMAQAMFQSSTL